MQQNVFVHNLDIKQILERDIFESVDLEDVQGALCEDGAEGGGQAELYQTL